MAVNGITLSGWKEFEQKALDLSKVLPEEMDEAAKNAAEVWESGAKLDAPVNFGHLKGLIVAGKESNANWKVSSGALYSPFMEWGTKSHVSVPADLSAYASEFRGLHGGDYFEFLNAILDWVKHKGIGGSFSGSIEKLSSSKRDLLLQVASRIAFFIMKYGVRPHPFFFQQRPKAEAALLGDLEQMINR